MINIYSQSGQVTYGIIYYTVDTENEKNSLPTKDKMGSKCYVIESETWYILNGNGEWVPFVGEDSTADAILISIKNMSAEQKDQLKEELDIEDGGAVSSVNGKTGAVVLNAEDVGGAQESLKLTATPTAGLIGATLMRGTWSGATWEEVVAAIQASRLIQVDVATIGKITLLYNLGSETYASSNVCVYYVGDTLYNVVIELSTSDGHGLFVLSIINARTETVNISGTTPTITPAANTTYNCGELTSLTISNPPATGAYSIVFTSGSTATTTTFPATILGLEDFAAEANTLYEINVLDNRAVVGSWAVTP